MKYNNIVEGKFIERPNRFIARVEIPQGKSTTVETVHVKNTGRCKELLIPGVRVWLEEVESPARKTKYDLIAVEKNGFGIINIDSQAPNKVMREWLEEQGYEPIKPESTYGSSRLDFCFGDPKALMEVKGCTLEIDGIGYFPDAPTQRGVKHIKELIKAKQEGYRAIIAFVIQMEKIDEVRPNIDTHKEFGEVMDEAREAGVEIWFMQCSVTPGELKINKCIKR